MRKINYSNIIGGIFCWVIVIRFWVNKLMASFYLKFPVLDLDVFDFLEGGNPLDPIDYANFIFSFYKFILCVIFL